MVVNKNTFINPVNLYENKDRKKKKKTVTFNLINNNNLRLKILVVTSAMCENK
jgi:hypothetical protein